MGCDIHCYIEHREKGRDRWDGFGGRINPGRNYELFGHMAGVRTEAQSVVPLRGLPNDLAWDAADDSSLYISTEEYDGACTVERAKYYVEKCGCSYINDSSGKPWRGVGADAPHGYTKRSRRTCERWENMTEAGWTSNVPANEGEYWFRSDGVRKPIVAHVYLDVEQDLRIIIGINDVYVTDLDGFDEFDGAEFLGPITPDSFQQGRVAALGEVERYMAMRLRLAEASLATEILAGNEVKQGRERAAIAELHGMQRHVSDIKEYLAQQAQEGGVGDAER